MLENLKRDEPFIRNSGTDLAEIGDDEEELLDPEEVLDSEVSLGGLEGLDDYLGDEEGEEDDDDGLGYIGLGARLRRGRRRRRRRGGRRLRRARAARPRRRRRRRRARVAAVTRPRRRRRRRRARVRAAAAPKPRRRRRGRRRRATVRTIIKTVKVPGPVRRVRGRRVRVGRRSRRRGRRMAGVGFGGVLSKLADTVALQSISSLGEGRRRRRRRRGGRRLRRATVAAPRRRRRRRRRGGRRLRAGRRGRARRRRGGRRRGRRMSGVGGFSSLSSLSRMGAGLADAEVAASWPILGPIQYLFSIPGLEALGGVTLGSFLHGIVQEGLMGMLIAKGKQMETLPQIGTGLLSAIVMWELGRLVGSGNLAKFGAYYALGKTIDTLVMKPYVVNKIFGLAGYGLGQARVSEEAELRGLSALSQARVSEEQELRDVGQRIVTEEELLGDVGEEGEEESSIF